MTIASPSRFVVADIKASLENSRDFVETRKIFRKYVKERRHGQPSIQT